ncbi:Uncharacterised protein [uncultured Blautia sp.]|nr:Uncharacterised protein [uncultured Blautia sp.]
MKYPDQNRISPNIHDIGNHGNRHGPLRILLSTEYGSRRVICCYKRKRQCCKKEICFRSTHDICFYRSENKPQQRFLKNKTDCRYRYRNCSDNKQHLSCRHVCFLIIFLTDILGTYNGTSCCQRRKGLDQKYIDGVYQRHRRKSRRSHIADHHGICGSHYRIQNLFQHNRNQKITDHPVGKHMLLFHCFIPHTVYKVILYLSVFYQFCYL